MEEMMTGLLSNLAPTFFFFFFCTSCNTLTTDTTSNHGTHTYYPSSLKRQHPTSPQPLPIYCHHRHSSCVTRLAVMRLSVSAAVSQRKSLATLDEPRDVTPTEHGEKESDARAERQTARKRGKRVGGRERERNKKIMEIGSNHGDSACYFLSKLASLNSQEWTKCFSIREGQCLRYERKDEDPYSTTQHF